MNLEQIFESVLREGWQKDQIDPYCQNIRNAVKRCQNFIIKEFSKHTNSADILSQKFAEMAYKYLDFVDD